MPDPNMQQARTPDLALIQQALGIRNDSALLEEIKALRSEVQQLTAAIKPIESLVATGQQVLDEYKRLKDPQ